MRGPLLLSCALLLSLEWPAAAYAEESCDAAVVTCCDLPTKSFPARETPIGLGYQIWPSSLAARPDAAAALSALKPRYLRFGLGPNWRRQPPLSPGLSDVELDAHVARGHASVASDPAAYAFLRNIHAETGAALIQIIWEPPPLPGDPDFQAAGVPAWRKLDAANIELMARFIVAELRFVAEAGVRLEGVEMINEPDGAWNLKVQPADYVALARAVRREAKRRGLALPLIYGPGSSTVGGLLTYLSDPKIGAAMVDSVDLLSVHGWDDAKGADRIAELDRLYAALARLKRRPTLAFTEFGVGRPVLSDASERMNSRKRAEDSVTQTPAFGAATIRELARLYGHGVGPVVYWEYQDQPWGHGLIGLIDAKGRKKPVYDAVARFVAAMDVEKIDHVDASADGRLAILHGRAGHDLLVAANADASPLDVVMRSRRLAGKAPKASPSCHEDSVGVAAESILIAPLAAP
jgi:hypothetical protein